MGESTREITCPTCGKTFVPPQRESFFCPGCGARMAARVVAPASEPPTQVTSAQSAQDQAAWAVEEAARAAAKAVEAARLAEEAGTRMCACQLVYAERQKPATRPEES